MPIKPVLDYLRGRLEQVINAPATIFTAADVRQDGLILLPYHFYIDNKLSNLPGKRQQGGQLAIMYCINLLLIQNHWQADLLGLAIGNLLDNPVASVDNVRVQIDTDALPVTELTAIFQSAQLPLAMCAALQLRCISESSQ
jgi:hypothetical protein